MDNGQAREVKLEKKTGSRIATCLGCYNAAFPMLGRYDYPQTWKSFFVKVAGDKLYGKFGIEFGCSDGGMSHHYLQYFLGDSFV